MRILSIHIFTLHNSEPIIISSAFELSFFSIFQRGTLKEFLNFHSRLVIGRLQPEQNLEVQLEKGICYAVTNSDKFGATLICDEEYPKRVAIDLLLKLLEKVMTFIYQNKIDVSKFNKDTNIKFNELDKTIQDAQNPEKIDNIVKIKSQLNEVQDIMKKNLDELLKREENLENLMAKSKDLSSTSVNFYKQAKKTNSCCNF
jgi:synaptobrevin family protein YKT6